MRLALYALILSGSYAALAAAMPDVASELTIAFVAALVVPGFVDLRRQFRVRRQQ